MNNLVPENWREISLEDLVEAKILGTTSRGTGSKNLLLLKMGNLKGGTINYNKVEFVEDSNELTSLILEYGDFLFNTRNTPELVGKVSNFRDRNTKAVYDNNLLRLKFKDNTDSLYMGYLYNLGSTVTKLKQIVAGTTSVAAIYWKDLSKLKQVLPPLPEQQKIAKILTSVDEVIDKTQAQIDKLKDLKTGMMQELLTNGIGHTEFKDSPVGRIPAEWEVVRVNELVSKVGSGVTPKGGSKAYVGKGIPLIRSQNLHSDGLRLDNVSFITDEQHQKMKGSQLQPNDVLLNITGASIGRCYYLADDFVEGNVNQHVCIIRLKRNLIGHVFLTLLLNGQFGQSQIMSLQAGGNREGLNFQQIREIKLPLPSIEEQTKISSALSSVERKIRISELKLTTIKNTKKALMQDLLTGNVRVKL
jgi:type I restriction enzyme S subunit